jgi:hypothetical protein
MATTTHRDKQTGQQSIYHAASAPPFDVPRGHVGPFVIPGTGRMVWWTGRVAIGLRHQPVRCMEPLAQSALWIQQLMLSGATGASGARGA